MIMQDERLDMPETAAEAENLYITLLNLINDYMDKLYGKSPRNFACHRVFL